MPGRHLRQLLPLAALATLLLAGGAAAGRILSQEARNVTAMDGPAAASAGGGAGGTSSSSGTGTGGSSAASSASAGASASASAGAPSAGAAADASAAAGAQSGSSATDASAASSAPSGSAAADASAAAGTSAVPTPSWLPSGTFSGDGTAYSQAVSDGTGFACSYRYLSPAVTTHFAAMNAPMWDDGHACGRCLTAWCVDPQCTAGGKKVTVMVVDKCPECKSGDVDFSIPVYREITGMWPDRLKIDWEWSDCSAMVEGDIVVTPKDGINPQWQAWYFANSKYPIQSVKVNGAELQYEEFQFWIHAQSLSKPATFELRAVNGAVTKGILADPIGGQQKIPNFV